MSITKFLNQKFLNQQVKEGKRLTVKQFANSIGASRELMSMWLNGKRKPGPKFKQIIIGIYGEEAVTAFGDDPHLWAIQKAWKHLTPKQREQFRKQIEKAAITPP